MKSVVPIFNTDSFELESDLMTRHPKKIYHCTSQRIDKSVNVGTEDTYQQCNPSDIYSPSKSEMRFKIETKKKNELKRRLYSCSQESFKKSTGLHQSLPQSFESAF